MNYKSVISIAVVSLIGCGGCSSESTEPESKRETASVAPTPTQTPNPKLTATQRDLVVQMYKEAVMLDKLYTDAFDAKDEDSYNKARGIGYALVRRHEKDPQIMDHPGYHCWDAFMSTNGARATAWYDLKDSGNLSDYAQEQETRAKQALQACEKAARETGILNEVNMAKPLPSITPVEIK